MNRIKFILGRCHSEPYIRLYVEQSSFREASKSEYLYFVDLFSNASTDSFESAENMWFIVRCGDFDIDKMRADGLKNLIIRDETITFDYVLN